MEGLPLGTSPTGWSMRARQPASGVECTLKHITKLFLDHSCFSGLIPLLFNVRRSPHLLPSLPHAQQEYDWCQHGGATVADIGGGMGHILANLLRQHPGMRGILYDRYYSSRAAIWTALAVLGRPVVSA